MDQILGQPRAIDQLQSQLQSGRLHHAYLFHGPAGVGKFTTALAFARALLCPSPQRDLAGRLSPCGTCDACVKLQHDAHPDLHVITKELAKFSDDRQIRERKQITIPFDVLRERLIGPVALKSHLLHGKVFIVDEAELIDPRGQNILLKTLEEPPEGTYLVLVTSNEDRMLPTIRSRCQRVSFVPLSDEAVAAWVATRAGDLDAGRRAWVASFASGSLGRASLAIEYELWTWGEAILPGLDALAKGRFDVGLGGVIGDAINAFAEMWVDRDKQASKAAANKLAASLMFSMIGQHARRRVAELAGKCNAADPVAAEAALEPWLGVIDALGAAEDNLAANVNLAMTCEHLVTVIGRRLAPA